MLHHVFEWVEPILINAILALLTAALGIVTRFMPKVIRQWLDGRRRDALHSAVAKGVDYALAVAESAALAVPAVGIVDRASGYIWRSVPGAIRYFFKDQADAAQRQINEMILARIREVAPDALDKALADAGVPQPR